MTYIRERAKLLLLSEAKLREQLHKAEERVALYMFLAFTGWSGLVVVLLTKYFP